MMEFNSKIERSCIRLLCFACHLLVFVGIVCCLSGSTYSQDYWVVLDRPTTRDLNRLSFLDSLRGWAAGDSGTILMTTDGGVSWSAQLSPVEFDIVDLNMINEKFGWALAHEYPHDTVMTYGTTVLRTTNGGGEWVSEQTFGEYFYAVEFVDSVNGCLGGNLGKLLWTNDGGVSWTSAVIDSPEFARWPIRTIRFFSPTYAFACGGLYDVTGLVWRTSDGGKFWTWQRVAGEPFFGIHFLDSMNVLCVGGDLDFGAGMVRTSDAGETWQYTYLGIWGQASAAAFRTDSEVWAPLGFAGTYMYSLDSGNTWTSLYTPDSSGVLDAVFIDSTTGYMVGAQGTVLKYVGPPLTVNERPPTAPEQPTLLQVYPNPFNPSTTIHYRVGERSFVTLSVYDLTGKLIRHLQSGLQSPGLHRVVLSGEGLASGVYFCRLYLRPVDGGVGYSRAVKMVMMR